MGGRSGQSIRSAPTIKVSVTNNLTDDSVKDVGVVVSEVAKQYGINQDLGVLVVRASNGNDGGAVSFEQTKDRGIYKISSSLEIRVSPKFTKQQIREIVKHELTHIKQSQDGRFYFSSASGKKGGYYFDGVRVIGAAAYSQILRDFRSPDKEARDKAYAKYRSLPWEIEAHKAGDPFKN